MYEAVDFPLMNHRFLFKYYSANPRIHWGVSGVYAALSQVLLIEHYIALHQLIESHFSKFHNHFSAGLLWISLFILLIPHVDLNEQKVDVHFSQSLRDFWTVMLFQDVLKHSGWDPGRRWGCGTWCGGFLLFWYAKMIHVDLTLVTDSLSEIFFLLKVIKSLNFCHTVNVCAWDLIGCCWFWRVIQMRAEGSSSPFMSFDTNTPTDEDSFTSQTVLLPENICVILLSSRPSKMNTNFTLLIHLWV